LVADQSGLIRMARRVNLDAMIPREDFGLEGDEFATELIRDY
jgi:hypothetical protein